jgi:hypothetical protein
MLKLTSGYCGVVFCFTVFQRHALCGPNFKAETFIDSRGNFP